MSSSAFFHQYTCSNIRCKSSSRVHRTASSAASIRRKKTGKLTKRITEQTARVYAVCNTLYKLDLSGRDDRLAQVGGVKGYTIGGSAVLVVSRLVERDSLRLRAKELFSNCTWLEPDLLGGALDDARKD